MVQVLDKPQKVQSFFPRLDITPEERLRRLIDEHRGRMAASFDELLGDGGMPGETADEIIKAVREWRDLPSQKDFD